MTVDLKHLTYPDYLDLPEMKARYSIVDGELVMDGSAHSGPPKPSYKSYS